MEIESKSDFESCIVFESFGNPESGNVSVGDETVVTFVLEGKEGVLQFMYLSRMVGHPWSREVVGLDLGVHSRKPLFKHHLNFGPCVFLGGEDCYYEGSSLAVEGFVKYLLDDDEKGLWQRMEFFYTDYFESYGSGDSEGGF